MLERNRLARLSRSIFGLRSCPAGCIVASATARCTRTAILRIARLDRSIDRTTSKPRTRRGPIKSRTDKPRTVNSIAQNWGNETTHALVAHRADMTLRDTLTADAISCTSCADECNRATLMLDDVSLVDTATSHYAHLALHMPTFGYLYIRARVFVPSNKTRLQGISAMEKYQCTLPQRVVTITWTSTY